MNWEIPERHLQAPELTLRYCDDRDADSNTNENCHRVYRTALAMISPIAPEMDI